MSSAFRQLLKSGQMIIDTRDAEGKLRASTQFYISGDVVCRVEEDLHSRELEQHMIKVKNFIQSLIRTQKGYLMILNAISVLITTIYTLSVIFSQDHFNVFVIIKPLSPSYVVLFGLPYLAFLILFFLRRQIVRLFLQRWVLKMKERF